MGGPAWWTSYTRLTHLGSSPSVTNAYHRLYHRCHISSSTPPHLPLFTTTLMATDSALLYSCVRVETNRPRYTRLLLNWLMVQCMLLLLWRMSKSHQSSVTSIPAFIMCIGRVINLIIMYFFFNFFLFIAFKVVEHLICHAQFHKKKKWKIKQKKIKFMKLHKLKVCLLIKHSTQVKHFTCNDLDWYWLRSVSENPRCIGKWQRENQITRVKYIYKPCILSRMKQE